MEGKEGNNMKKTPNATLRRYPIYLKALRKIKSEGKDKIMSSELSEYVNIKSTTIRRDFSLIGCLGKQGYGYNVEELINIFAEEPRKINVKETKQNRIL